jgi:hypothetical protein
MPKEITIREDWQKDIQLITRCTKMSCTNPSGSGLRKASEDFSRTQPPKIQLKIAAKLLKPILLPLMTKRPPSTKE